MHSFCFLKPGQQPDHSVHTCESKLSKHQGIISIGKRHRRLYKQEDENIAGRKRLVTLSVTLASPRVTVMSLFIINENAPRLCRTHSWHVLKCKSKYEHALRVQSYVCKGRACHLHSSLNQQISVLDTLQRIIYDHKIKHA